MNELFWRVINVGLSVSWLILAIVILRLVLKKAPRAMHVAMWALVALRLMCPVTIESEFSLVPQHEISQQTIENWTVQEGDTALSFDMAVPESPKPSVQMPDVPVYTPPASNSVYTNPDTTVIFPQTDNKQSAEETLPGILPIVWLLGSASMLLYGAFGYFRISRRLRTAIILEKNIYCTDYSGAPFVFGIIKPKIYIPFNMRLHDMGYVIAHENAHIRRKDYLWKPIGYLLLSVYWFNPLMWLAYSLLCKDIELACDEYVVKSYDLEQRADYSQALLSCSANRAKRLACPVAFGETSIRERIKNVLRYKKPALWITVVAIVAIVVCGICFLTAQPAEATEPDETFVEPTETIIEKDEAVVPEKDGVQYFPNGVAYTIKALDVRASHISLEIMTDLPAGQQMEMYHLPPFWLEEKTELGWDVLSGKGEAQWSSAKIHLTGYANSEGVEGCSYSWNAEWSDLYGLLPTGEYRIGLRVTEDAEPYYVEFSLAESKKAEINEELDYCRQAVDQILNETQYHVLVRQTSELKSIASETANQNILGVVQEQYQRFVKSGEDYLELHQRVIDGEFVTNDGSMKKDGTTYRLDNIVEWDSTSGVAGWSVWSEPRSNLFTWWANAGVWNAQQIDDVIVDGNTITFQVNSGTESDKTENVFIFTFSDDGNLQSILRESVSNNYDGYEAEYVFEMEITVLSVNDPQVGTMIEEQDVNFYREYSWAEDAENLTIIQDDPKPREISKISTAPEAIAAAMPYSDGDHTKIVVYRDEATKTWRVEFQRDYGYRGYLYIYLDDLGYYYGHAEGARRP